MEASQYKKYFNRIAIVICAMVVSAFAFYGAFEVSARVYKIAAIKIEDINAKAKTKFTFGRDVVVKDSFGGPTPEAFEEVPITYLKRYVISDEGVFPNINAKYFLIADLETGQVIANKDENKSVPIASLTKLMTAVVADEDIGLEKETAISNTAVDTYGRQGSLKRGETYTVEGLLYPLLLESSNDAAEAIAEYDNHFAFMLDMNAKAKLLKMEETFFEDPSGLSEKNVSSASDLFSLIQYIDKYRSYILDISKEKSHKIGNKVWYSNSKFRNDKNYLGGKNGYTDEAGKTNIAIFSLKLEDDEYRKIAIIVLNSQNTEKDTRSIINYLNKYVTYE